MVDAHYVVTAGPAEEPREQIERAFPYQHLINLYLRECAATKKRLELDCAA
jgi:hypothetical protein